MTAPSASNTRDSEASAGKSFSGTVISHSWARVVARSFGSHSAPDSRTEASTGVIWTSDSEALVSSVMMNFMFVSKGCAASSSALLGRRTAWIRHYSPPVRCAFPPAFLRTVMPGEDDRIPYAVVCRHSPLRAAEDLELHGNELDMPVENELAI